MKIATKSNFFDLDDEYPTEQFMEPPIRKLGEPTFHSQSSYDENDWPIRTLGGLCDHAHINPNRCEKVAEVDTWDGLLCKTCNCIREGWLNPR